MVERPFLRDNLLGVGVDEIITRGLGRGVPICGDLLGRQLSAVLLKQVKAQNRLT